MRIALIGSAPSSAHLAPYGDPSWTIWGCSPGSIPFVKRTDVWFEMHPLDLPDITPDYIQWMAGLGKPVYLIEPDTRIPEGIKYPRDEMVKGYGPFFFTSSLSWMFALAIQQKPTEIGLWGVDMSATEEYGYQRAGCHYFIMLAQAQGIKITVPAESDLLRPPPLYGYCMGSNMYRKLAARKTELATRETNAAAAYEQHRNEWHFLKGARDNLEYVMNTWMD